MEAKRELTSVDLVALVRELGELAGATVDKAYLYGDDLVRLKLRDYERGRVELLLEVGDGTDDGFSHEGRTTLASYLSTYGTVHVVGDGRIDAGLPSSRIDAEDPAIHDVLAYADLYVGNDARRVTEAALLGTPAVRVSSKRRRDPARLADLETRGLLDRYDREADAIRRVRELVPNPAARSVWRQRRDALLASNVDVAGYATDAICAGGEDQPAGRSTLPVPGEFDGSTDT